ncbi:MAG TPA: hypothetical protein EYQ84_07660, partial [Nitrospinaceae bacterium]|nr:hypothetical protein [Nitrospinaceae bacterium]
GGIAVGMATSIPPHNLGEIIDGTVAFINNRDISISQLMKKVTKQSKLMKPGLLFILRLIQSKLL